MDTTDPDIAFDNEGVCNHCRQFEGLLGKQWFPNAEGLRRLDTILDRIRAEGRGREYDSILGLSGGADSTYLALKMRDWGLRPLVVHVDGGWNSELAVANIERVVKHCNYDLHTHVVDWEEMGDLQLAYLRAGIPNQDVPQDHVFFASLYHFATQNGIRTIFSGGNLATEGIFPGAWHGSAMDAINLRSIHDKFGTRPLRSYTTISFFRYYFWFPFVRKMRTVRPLNYMPYVKADAIAEMERTFGYKPYERKHGESLFTKLFQNYYLPTKFGYDKRLPHYSSLIASGQMTREEALERLEQPLYEPRELEADITYFCKKLRISRAEFDEIMKAPNHHHTDFPTWESRQRVAKSAQSAVEWFLGRRVSVYS
ncbi:MAG: N-acetyl sugar amidotransferase [Rhizobiaceae bacterium]|nr:N-acetyl sugar amidotransferase [Parvibaculum sp.]MBO6725849.1 N-acetyl sugar amidotransferase [Rhizobiaceae bacterium]